MPTEGQGSINVRADIESDRAYFHLLIASGVSCARKASLSEASSIELGSGFARSVAGARFDADQHGGCARLAS